MDEGASGPPIVSIVSIGFAGAMGLLLWIKNRWPWVFITALLVFIFEGIPIELVKRVAGSGAEVLFIMAREMVKCGPNWAGERISILYILSICQ